MSHRLFRLFLFWSAVVCSTSFSQEAIDTSHKIEKPANPELAAELMQMKESDQKERATLQATMIANQGKALSAEDNRQFQELIQKQEERDRQNQKRLIEIIEKHGWPGKRLVGFVAGEGAFLILQHADQALQEKYFPLFKKVAESGDAKASNAAMLEDRILMRQGKPQIYGTQLKSDATGKIVLAPIEDEIHVDERRSKVGLPPLKDYLKLFGLEYVPPSTVR